MSQHPETGSPSSGSAPDTRWLSAIVWLGLLAALLVTSAYAIYATTYGLLASATTGFSSSGPRDNTPTAIASVILSVVAALAVINAWLRFVRATSSLVPGTAGGGESGANVSGLTAWLVPGREPPDETGETSGGELQRPPTGARDVLINVGATWFVLIITPAVLVFMRAIA